MSIYVEKSEIPIFNTEEKIQDLLCHAKIAKDNGEIALYNEIMLQIKQLENGK
jgi:hypothetical protein